MNEKLRKLIVVICSVVFISCLAGIALHYVRQYHEGQVDEQVSELVSETPSATPSPTQQPATPEITAEPTPTPLPQPLEKYAALVEENPDTIGWLKIENTAIDNVVMYTPDEPDKYLHIDFYGNYSNRGTLYLEEDCDIWTSDNLIIYGHHMQSSAMFGNLDYFASESYWEDHKYIQFNTIYEEQTYEVVAAFYSHILYQNEEGFRYYKFINADDENAFCEYVTFIDENQCYDTGVDINYGDRLLTLSTCAYHVENGRFAVVAKLVTNDNEDDTTEAAETTPNAEGIDESPDVALVMQISEENVPLSSTPAQSKQNFSINMIFLALGLIASGACLMANIRKK